jgi:hypothetical protein
MTKPTSQRFTLFTSQRYTFALMYLYQKDEWPTAWEVSKPEYFLFPPLHVIYLLFSSPLLSSLSKGFRMLQTKFEANTEWLVVSWNITWTHVSED